MEPHWTNYVTAMMTPVVACFGAWIAYQQWNTARDKLRLDLSEKRMVIYAAAQEALAAVFARRDLTPAEEAAYLKGVAGARWLYGKDVTQYLQKEFWGKLCDLHRVAAEMEGMPRSEEREALVEQRLALRKWFLEQHDFMDNLFYPYLGFTHRSKTSIGEER